MLEPDPSDSSSDPSVGRNAGGVFLAFGTIAGAVIGALMGQASAGFLIGLAAGGIVALLLWLKER